MLKERNRAMAYYDYDKNGIYLISAEEYRRRNSPYLKKGTE